MKFAVASPEKVKKPRKRPRFWLGPLVVGISISLGYGVTQRIIILRSGHQQPERKMLFDSQASPGQSLESLRQLHGGSDTDLQADIAAQEALLEADRQQKQKAKDEAERKLRLKAKQESERLAAEARQRQKDLDEELNPPVPTLPDTDFSATDLSDPPRPPSLPPNDLSPASSGSVSLPASTASPRDLSPTPDQPSAPIHNDTHPANHILQQP